MIQQVIGFAGAGMMAEALMRGLLTTKICTPEEILASDINEIRLAHINKTFRIQSVSNNLELAKRSQVLILAVKPQHLSDVLKELRPGLNPKTHILISIAAGVPTSFIERETGRGMKVVRVMPNTPSRLLAGAAAFCLGQSAGEAEALLTRRLFEAIGIVVRIKEDLMNAVTAVSGSGPAYVFKLCEMMIAAGVEMGIPANDAEALAVQTIWGAAQLLHESGEKPAALRKAVTSPGGTTQAALDYLDTAHFDMIFKKALLAACDRGRALCPKEAEE